MVEVVGVRFQNSNKMYYFAANGHQFLIGNSVIVETSRGFEYGFVIKKNVEIEESELVQPVRPVVRFATYRDHLENEENKRQETYALKVFEKKALENKLEIKAVDVEYTFDRNKMIFFFTAEGRIDFRNLVKDLAAIYKTRIELRQIGVRDEAKKVGGIGPCGKSLCCASWLRDFHSVSIKMAKDQNLSLNPTKISGVCGRLYCCLKYEHALYEQSLKKAPQMGSRFVTTDGKNAKIIGYQPLLERVNVELYNEDGIVAERTTLPLEELPQDEWKKNERSTNKRKKTVKDKWKNS